MSVDVADDDLVGRYLCLGLSIGRLLDGLVDAYYGPPEWRDQIASAPAATPAALGDRARRLIADLEHDHPDLDAARRRWIGAQVRGLATTCRKLAGEAVPYVEEVEASYGVTPTWIDEDEIVNAHRRLDASLSGSGSLPDRLAAFRSSHAIEVDTLRGVIDSLADEFRDRTRSAFGLPDGEHVDFELVADEPWSGFNYYLGDLHSRVAINTDLPVLSTSIGHLVAHEAYPGHHTEHCRKEVGLVRSAGWLEESIFMVGTPQCVVAEGLADLGIEVLLGLDHRKVLGELLAEHGVTYDLEAVDAVADFGEVSSRVRGNIGLLLNDRRVAAEDAAAYAERWLLLDPTRAQKIIQFQSDPTWRAYISCYVEGLPLCRAFVSGSSDRFERLLSEQLLPEDLVAPV